MLAPLLQGALGPIESLLGKVPKASRRPIAIRPRPKDPQLWSYRVPEIRFTACS